MWTLPRNLLRTLGVSDLREGEQEGSPTPSPQSPPQEEVKAVGNRSPYSALRCLSTEKWHLWGMTFNAYNQEKALLSLMTKRASKESGHSEQKPGKYPYPLTC